MKIIDFIITKEDYDASEGSFSPEKCPFFQAAKKVLPNTSEVGFTCIWGRNKPIGEIKDFFGYENFEALERGEEFKTQLTIY